MLNSSFFWMSGVVLLFLCGLVYAGPGNPPSKSEETHPLKSDEPSPTKLDEPVTYDDYNRPNLCLMPEHIVIGEVESVFAERYEMGNYQFIRSIVGLRVLRSIDGDLPEGKEFRLRLRGGELEGITAESADPLMHKGDQYLLFLESVNEEDFLPKMAFYRIPNSIVGKLPTSDILQRGWVAVCKQHPEGIFFRGPRIELTIPADLWFEGLLQPK